MSLSWVAQNIVLTASERGNCLKGDNAGILCGKLEEEDACTETVLGDMARAACHYSKGQNFAIESTGPLCFGIYPTEMVYK